MTQITDIKTKSFIQSFYINGGRPKSGANAYPVIVRPPQTMKCFRATISINDIDNNNPGQVFISTAPVNGGDEGQCLVLNCTSITDALSNPYTNYNSIQTFVFDRRSVGYMTDEFYLYSDDAFVSIVWEGILIQE